MSLSLEIDMEILNGEGVRTIAQEEAEAEVEVHTVDIETDNGYKGEGEHPSPLLERK